MPPKKAKRHETLLVEISDELYKQLSKNKMIEHYMKDYDNIPPWILVSIFSFGMLRSFLLLSWKQRSERDIQSVWLAS